MRKLGFGAVALAVLAACGGESPSSPPPFGGSPSPGPSEVVPGKATGPTGIAFASADPPPGSVVSGCGTDATGCPGRVRMVFRLTPTMSGHVLHFDATLHANTKRACFVGQTAVADLRAGQAVSVPIVLDPVADCRTPFAITDLAASLEGTVEVASRQEWSIGYTFAP
jgi:hypothetical protein